MIWLTNHRWFNYLDWKNKLLFFLLGCHLQKLLIPNERHLKRNSHLSTNSKCPDVVIDFISASEVWEEFDKTSWDLRNSWSSLRTGWTQPFYLVFICRNQRDSKKWFTSWITFLKDGTQQKKQLATTLGDFEQVNSNKIPATLFLLNITTRCTAGSIDIWLRRVWSDQHLVVTVADRLGDLKIGNGWVTQTISKTNMKKTRYQKPRQSGQPQKNTKRKT